ncbi:hypothetical protein B484DRAFT_445987, partial [Ochromonadaceae sp. CCMP2298]
MNSFSTVIIKIMIYQTVLALALAATGSATLFTKEAAHAKYMWEAFKSEYRREYQTMEEETQRFGFFFDNMKAADERNEAELKAGGSAVHGITKFSDLSQAEFRSRYLTADIKMKTDKKQPPATTKPPKTDAGLVDWTGIYTTPLKDQGYCGSCWAFSATEQIESDSMRTLGTSYILSPEQITQCDDTSFGCSGGWTESAYAYVKRAGGMETEANYPYTSYQGVTGSCKSKDADFVVGLTGFNTITGESNMAAYVQTTGPLSVCLDANTWNSYTGGIMSVCGQSVDHCVQAVGVDVGGGYWKVRNSWGTSWGESGFILLAYGANTCDITYDPTWTQVSHRGALLD